MKFPKMPQSSKEKERVSKIGGMASALHPAALSPDRLHDSLNLFNKEGLLTTREGFLKTSGENLIDFSFTTVREKVFFADFAFTEFYGFDTLAVLSREELFAHTCLDFFVLDKTGNRKKLFHHEIVAANGYTTFEVKNAVFLKATAVAGSGLFIILPLIRTELKTGVTSEELRIFEFNNNYNGLIYVDTSKFYCPIIMKHGHGDHYRLATDEPIKDTEYPEGVNLLNGAFEADFSTDGNSDTFRLPVSIKNSTPITIHLYTADTVYRTFTIPSSADRSTPEALGDANLYFKVDRAKGIIYSMDDNGLYILPRYKKHNSLRVFAYTDTGNAAYSIFSQGTKPIAFDGRLFFPSGDTACNKIFYSGKNQHLYYSEENSFSIGDDENNVTVLSKQGKYVIAFKSKEVYRITLSESQIPNRETIIENDLIKKVPQPEARVVRINDTIGCDCPDTVKNCGNRLVWYHSNGGVYTLYGSNNYTEGSVYELSGEIKDKLLSLSDEDNKNIKAIDVHGRYALATNTSIFIMDSLISGFTYLLGHKNADKKYSGPSWFYWETPQNTKLISSYSRKGVSYYIMANHTSDYYYIASLSGKFDTVIETETIKTALPEFNFTTAFMGEDQKCVDKISLHIYLENIAHATIFDINNRKIQMPITPYGKFVHYNFPFSFKKGKVGLTLCGKGSFALDNISCNIRE